MNIEFSTDNAAFDDGNNEQAIVDCLLQVASAVVNSDRTEGTIRDPNGNTIGKWSM